jgi:hypothetical protein
MSSHSSKAYKFVVQNGMVTAAYEVEDGTTKLESVDRNETWSVNANLVIKTKYEDGQREITVYSDDDGNGIYAKASTRKNTGDNGDLHGNDGNDHLHGSSGDEHIDGGNGIDDVSYQGSRHEYAIKVGTTGVSVDDSNATRDGTDTLSAVERLHFNDGSLALDTDGHAGQAYRLYKAAFDRESDESGLGYWLNRLDHGATLESVANSFIASAEFKALYGEKIGDDQFVEHLYNNVLDRTPDAGGKSYWLDSLEHGMTREKVLINFSESAENQTNVAPLVLTGIPYQEMPA